MEAKIPHKGIRRLKIYPVRVYRGVGFTLKALDFAGFRGWLDAESLCDQPGSVENRGFHPCFCVYGGGIRGRGIYLAGAF